MENGDLTGGPEEQQLTESAKVNEIQKQTSGWMMGEGTEAEVVEIVDK
jgi:hypothetical protein